MGIKSSGLRSSCEFSVCAIQHREENGSGHPSRKHVNGVVGVDVNRGKAQQDVERQEEIQQRAVFRRPYEEHQNGAYAHMAAWEGCRRAFSCGVGIGHYAVEEAVLIARTRQRILMGGEVVPQVGEVSARNLRQSYGVIVVLRPRDGQCYIYNVVDEERREDDKRRAAELPVTPTEEVDGDNDYHGEVGRVAQVHQFAEHRSAEVPAKEQ